MQPLEGDERGAVLRSLLNDEDEPGDQVGWQLAEHEVGLAFATPDGRAALVVTQRFAVLYGEPVEEVGRFLVDGGFIGTLQGALARCDVLPAVESLDIADTDILTRLVLRGDDVRSTDPFPDGPLTVVRVSEELEPKIAESIGWWVFEMWPRPSAAPHALALLADHGQLLALGASYAVSPRYAEIAAWIDPLAAGVGLVAAGAYLLLGDVVRGGRAISATILVTNAGARGFAAGAGWVVVGEASAVRVRATGGA